MKLVSAINADQSSDAGIEQQRARVTELKAALIAHSNPQGAGSFQSG